jgi:ABC-type phosphate transport system substrate-binding protein
LSFTIVTTKGIIDIKNWKMMKIKHYISLLLFAGLILSSCNRDVDPEAKSNQEERKNIVCIVDESLSRVMDKPLAMFDSLFQNYDLKIEKASAFDAMAKLFAQKTEVIIIGRDYSNEEDSLMKAHLMEPYFKMEVAEDALVFFTNPDFPLDTLTDEQIKAVMTEGKYLKEIYPKLKDEPTFVIPNNLSSEFLNFRYKVLDGKKVANKKDWKTLNYLPSADSVNQFVLDNKNSIGIGFFSNIVKDTRYKPLAVSYIDSTGKYVFPHVVHQANILQELYPYTVKLNIFISDQDDKGSLALGRFMSKSSKSQKYFNEFGIVPGYAKIKLIDER